MQDQKSAAKRMLAAAIFLGLAVFASKPQASSTVQVRLSYRVTATCAWATVDLTANRLEDGGVDVNQLMADYPEYFDGYWWCGAEFNESMIEILD